jgi:hypothetical protein
MVTWKSVPQLVSGSGEEQNHIKETTVWKETEQDG